MSYTFLLLDLFLLLIPFCLLLDRKTIGFGQLVSGIVPSFLATVIFTEMAIFWTNQKVITFNNAYVLGLYYRWLPVEFYLFTFAFSFACLMVYFYLNAKFPSDHLQKYSFALSNVILGLCIAFLFFAYTKWYSVLTFGLLFLLLAFIEYKNELRFMYRFYRVFAFSLILFFISYGLLCNLPVLSYKQEETVGFSLFKIPFENYFLMMAMLLFVVYVAEFIKSRRIK